MRQSVSASVLGPNTNANAVWIRPNLVEQILIRFTSCVLLFRIIFGWKISAEYEYEYHYLVSTV